MFDFGELRSDGFDGSKQIFFSPPLNVLGGSAASNERSSCSNLSSTSVGLEKEEMRESRGDAVEISGLFLRFLRFAFLRP
jgi:hypothetical protein